MRKTTASLLSTGLVLACVFGAAAQDEPAEEGRPRAAEAEDQGFKMVINSANRLGELPVREIQRIFKKNTTRWAGWVEDGKEVPVDPVDRERGAEVRKLFSKRIFRKSASAIESYWQRQIFSGDDIPPEKLASEADVIEFVLQHRGGIGYVSTDTVLKDGVKELKVID